MCRSYDISPYNCMIIHGYDVPEPIPKDWVDSIKQLLGALFDVELSFFVGYTPRGLAHQQLLIKFKDAAAKQKALAHVTDDTVTLDKTQYQVTVFDDDKLMNSQFAKPHSSSKSHQFLRRIKPFSGAERPAGGELDVHEWLTMAYELRDDHPDVSSGDKLKWLKNSLIKGALLLVSSSVVNDVAELIQLIALTYGASHSKEHLLTQIYKERQLDKEGPSVFLSRLQGMMMELKRFHPNAIKDSNKFRLDQFAHGLKSADFDLLDLRLHLTTWEPAPTFAELLKEVQTLERDRKERDQRSGGRQAGCHSLATQFALEHEQVVDSPTENSASYLDIAEELKKTNLRLDQIVEQATHVETSDRRKVSCQSATAERKHFPKPKGKGKTANTRNRVCWNCGEKGHIIYSCTEEWDRQKVCDAMERHMAKRRPRTSELENSQRD